MPHAPRRTRVRTIEWTRGRVVMIDQRLLPVREVYRVYDNYREVARAIKDMVIRGAPAIGVAAAMGIALGVRHLKREDLRREFDAICRTFAATRPTAVNLFWAIERMRRVYAQNATRDIETLRLMLEREARAIYEEDIAANRALGAHGAALIEDGSTILTHCNAGALATAGYGTALGVMRAAVEANKRISVYCSETRPYLQGARLTAWELKKEHIPATLITDNMVGHMMKEGRIDCVVVGTDRTAANGDVANKIGTYTVAVLAHRHGIPFYVAAPTSSIDLGCPRGSKIPIEERNGREVTHIFDRQVAPSGIKVANPAFDVTPHDLVTAIITERGIARPPYNKSLVRIVKGEAPKSATAPRTSGKRQSKKG
ncbi:MAG: S-methyl-5-thioribose-1-phosphate isomerase [Polyangiaceae bacterium UTPRO1]|jgi:methylthioribose-1-phosphate isomerase|nr:S-methyl-5-thioribose-1-phosphate isomerase [Myxococcales bacterium]OQY67988.1 MAG: S-methyl-5-thioribose-1-phosphate isomerase [Polyangiaceae bacterium UTPRO1]